MPEEKKLIIIGAGMTGLSAALAWCKNVDVENNPVTIIEKQSIVGGYVTTYSRKGYLFDTTQIIPDVSDILNYFDVDIDLIQFKGYYARIFITDPKTGNVMPFKIPSSLKGFEYYLVNRFPGDAKRIKQFFMESKKMYDELFLLKYNPGIFDLLRMFFTCRRIIAHSNKTFKQYFDRFKFKSPEIREIFNVFAAFSGLPAERVSALLTIGAMHATLKGAFRPTEGFISFPLAFKKQIEDYGGEIIRNRKVTKILTKKGKVIGVQLENGNIIEADYVITTIDAKVAMKELVGLDIVSKFNKKYARKVETMKMSPSSLHISLGLDNDIDLTGMGFDCGYNVLTSGGDTFEQLFEAFDLGKVSFSPKLFHCGIIAPSETIKKKNVLTIRVVPVPAKDWIKMRDANRWLYDKEKNDIAEFFIGLVEKYLIPGLSKHIVIKEIATPATFARYSGSPTGSNYDMAPVPGNFGINRLRMITPIKNLYQPKLSNGIWPSLQSGLQAIDHILGGKIMNGNSRYRKE